LRECVAFSGALAAALALACVRPRRVRWRDALRAAARAGADAVPIVCILGFLMGLIIAFQAAIPMSKLGAEIYVADLVGVATLRELGPLVTCVILAGRTGSAFAAEIGTMRVNEELDALRAMGLDPVAFLAVPRVLAVLAVTPPLALFANLTGIVGAIVVLLSMGYPLSACLNETLSMLRPGDLAGGLLKALVFGLIVAAIGCLRGLQTRDGPDAVGVSATRAVVGGIILIVIADGLFAVLFHCLKI
ncbi:MAG: ABC transporter permease, partial [Opitutaceae bacterium]|nr:ABC transporter permease [Opitutaceae bacterium]